MKHVLLAALAILLLAIEEVSGSQETPNDCRDFTIVEYRSAVPPGTGDIRLASMSLEEADSAAIVLDNRKASPQGTAWAALLGPGSTQPEQQLNSAVYVFSNRARNVRLKIEFLGHASGGVNTSWMNEKLLWLQVWWGRIGSTDLILDIDAADFIYEESANYGPLLRACQ